MNLSFWILTILASSSHLVLGFQSSFTVSTTKTTRQQPTFLKAESNSDKATRAQGVYVRPSGAIEKGSGFFVPGLEGPRVRVLGGTVLLALTLVNHQATTTIGGWSLEEGLAIGYSLLVLFQAAIEYGKEELIVEGTTTTTSSTSTSVDLQQAQWAPSTNLAPDAKDAIQWAAASYRSVTPATQILLLQQNHVLYRLGKDSTINLLEDSNDNQVTEGIQAALTQLESSKGGRLALPPTHPTVVGLGLEEARTVVLQRITPQACWVVSSQDQLLASFTNSDLQWLGHLARYVEPHVIVKSSSS